jgi:NitT/TauT family transport system ATP-binding protein
MDCKSDILLENLSINFSDPKGTLKKAVAGVTLNVFPGEIVSIVGPSGCGKTSILRAVMNEIEYEGKCSINATRETELGYLHQTPSFLPWRTALENAVLGHEVRGIVASIHRVQELLADFGIAEEEMLYYPDQLSGGMKQRVAIARALEASPKVLLCDEPFSAIDFINRLNLNRLLKQRLALKVSVLLVTHNIDEAIFLSSRIYVMSGSPGRIVDVVEPKFKHFITDPVALREEREFECYFNQIWHGMAKNEC